MHLVAHVQGLGNQMFEIDPARILQRPLQHRKEGTFHPGELFNHLSAVRTVTQHPAQAFVEGAESPVAVGFILNDKHRHRGGDDPGHRPHRLVLVAGSEGDLPGGGQLLRFRNRFRPPFVEQAADHRSAHRAAHPLPGNRRAGM